MHILKRVLLYIFYGLLAYMPFHLFLSRWLSLYTGGLGQWDAAKDFVTLFGLIIAIIIAVNQRLFKHRFVLILFILSATYCLLHVLFFVLNHQNLDARSFVVATVFNGRLFAYLFIGLITSLTHNIDWKKITKIILIVSTITCFFGLLQYVAPKDLMTHFGYSIERGAKPSFFIDDKPDFPRIMSTVRDPNSYGAYLILPTTLIWILIVKRKISYIKGIALLALHGLTILLTFSRGAWLGMLLAGTVSVFRLYRNQITLFLRRYSLVVVILAALLVTGFLLFRNTYVYKNVVMHSDESTVMADPNELRVQLQEKSFEKIKTNPEGYGPGTAGLTSIGNPKGTFLTENYYLQIAIEVGLVGLALFLTILVLVGVRIFAVNSVFGDLLASSLIAYVFIGFLIHLWSNEAVAAQWWLLAGLVVFHANTSKRKANSSILQKNK